jgi:hypothetical protein
MEFVKIQNALIVQRVSTHALGIGKNDFAKMLPEKKLWIYTRIASISMVFSTACPDIENTVLNSYNLEGSCV